MFPVLNEEEASVNRGSRCVLIGLAILVMLSAGDIRGYSAPGTEAGQVTSHLVGYAHSDIDWLWEWPETKELWKNDATTLLQIMQEHPEFRYSQSQQVMYDVIKKEHPELFEQIVAAVKRGQWEPLPSWCESDMNIPSGESLVRQFLLGNNFNRDNFGITNPVGWRPDSFGHAWTIPQILLGCDIPYYYFCRGGRGEQVFWWESPDGSRVLAFNEPQWYNLKLASDNVVRVPEQYARKYGIRDWMTVYGVGDHGGGPTREDIATAKRLMEEPGPVKARFSSAKEFFDALCKDEPVEGYPVISDELNPIFEGCYTTHVETKRNNRRGEQTLYSAEVWASMAHLLGGPYPYEDLRKAWEEILRNQFHDILPGSNIHASYLYAEQRYKLALELAEKALKSSVSFLAKQIDTRNANGGYPIVVFNSLSWSRSDVVEVALPSLKPGNTRLEALDSEGRSSPVELTFDAGGKAIARFVAKDVPAVGYKTFWLKEVEEGSSVERSTSGAAGGNVLENEFFRIEFDPVRGFLTRIYDKRLDRDILALGGGGDLMQILWEGPEGMNAWVLGPIQRTTPLYSTEAEPPKVETFPGGSRLILTQTYYGSTITHTLSLRDGLPRIDFDLNLDWQLNGWSNIGGPMLKVAFETSIDKGQANFEIPFGAIERPRTGREVVAQKWVDLTALEETPEPGKIKAKPVPVPLDTLFNADAFRAAGEGRGGAGFDDQDIAYPSEMMPEAGIHEYEGVPFILPDAAAPKNNVVLKGQRLVLPQNGGGDIYVLGASNNGSYSARVIVRFEDGHEERALLALSDWVIPAFGKTAALSYPFRRLVSGATESAAPKIWVQQIKVRGNGPIHELVLPDSPRMHIFALTIVPHEAVSGRPLYGVALLNDGRYGFDVNGNTIRMTLIRTPYDPDPVPEVGRHELRYAIYSHEGSWQDSDVPKRAWEFNTPLVAIAESEHEGALSGSRSFLSLDGDGLILSALKRAERSDDLILRFYDSEGNGAQASLRFDLPAGIRSVRETNMVERPLGNVALSGQVLRVMVGPWKVKTYELQGSWR